MSQVNKNSTYDRTVGLCLLVFCALLYWNTFSFKTRLFVELNTTFWPRTILAILAIIGLILVIRGKLTDEVREPISWKSLLTAGVGLFYVVLIPVLGFVPLTIVFLTLSFSVIKQDFSRQALVKGMIIAVLATVVIYTLFGQVMNVQLPGGFWE